MNLAKIDKALSVGKLMIAEPRLRLKIGRMKGYKEFEIIRNETYRCVHFIDRSALAVLKVKHVEKKDGERDEIDVYPYKGQLPMFDSFASVSIGGLKESLEYFGEGASIEMAIVKQEDMSRGVMLVSADGEYAILHCGIGRRVGKKYPVFER